MKMGEVIRALVALLAFVSACQCAKSSMRVIHPTTTTTTLPLVSISLSPRSNANVNPTPMPLDTLASSPPAQCVEATSSISPLGRLRAAMRSISYTQINGVTFDAFLVFFSDEHLSEEPAPEERRLEYISGWDGAGTAAVLADGGAAIWVPSSDVIRAKMTVSCAWIVLDADDLNQPTIAEWVADRIGRAARVGADARLTSIGEWQSIASSLQRSSMTLTHVPTLLDQLWSEEPDPLRRRPEPSKIVAMMHDERYTGLSWNAKLQLIRKEFNDSDIDAMVVTALDEVAWLLNVRGMDIPFAPLFKAFVYVTRKEVKVYAPPGKIEMRVREALDVYSCFVTSTNNCTRVIDYTNIYSDLRRATESKILIPTAGTFQRGASAAIVQSIPQTKRVFQTSPIVYMKAQKNKAEIKGMYQAHLWDAVAMSTLLSYLEGTLTQGLTEISVAKKVDNNRATQKSYNGMLSMPTRVAYGPSGAEPNYRPTNYTNREIFKNSTLIIRSGGQYKEGTTVVTRTLHYGFPSLDMKTAYTTVLRSMAAMVTLQIPAAMPAAHTDPVARRPLWAANQDYPHPTGHGIGAALNRREDPVVIDYRQDTNLHTFKEGYFITSEPAWYERSKYGVQLGNVLEVVQKSENYLGFKEATLIPFEPKLIDKTMLTEYEINWLNSYNERIRKEVGPELKGRGLLDVYYWMANKTARIEPVKLKRSNVNVSSGEDGARRIVIWNLLITIWVAFFV